MTKLNLLCKHMGIAMFSTTYMTHRECELPNLLQEKTLNNMMSIMCIRFNIFFSFSSPKQSDEAWSEPRKDLPVSVSNFLLLWYEKFSRGIGKYRPFSLIDTLRLRSVAINFYYLYLFLEANICKSIYNVFLGWYDTNYFLVILLKSVKFLLVIWKLIISLTSFAWKKKATIFFPNLWFIMREEKR